MAAAGWFRIRIGLIVLAACGGMLMPPRTELYGDLLQSLPPWLAVTIVAAVGVVAMVTLPLTIVGVIGFQVVRATMFQEANWRKPTHHVNPFQLHNPAIMFHYFAYVIGASGLGMAVAGLWHGWHHLIHGLLVMIGAAMALLGIRLAMRVFHARFTDDAT